MKRIYILCEGPGGPTERTIEYHNPLDRCDREQDYETAWEFSARLQG